MLLLSNAFVYCYAAVSTAGIIFGLYMTITDKGEN
jgi:hypothetical protein